MEYAKLIKERYSVRKFESTPLTEAEITEILEAGRVAPTGCNLQPQRILVLDTEEAMTRLRLCTKCHFDAPSAMLVCFDKADCWTRKYDGATSGLVDASIVATHMLLKIHDMGLGATWVMHFDPFKMREAFNIPEGIEPIALLVMGHPASDSAPIQMHFDSKPIDVTVVYNSF